jgi:hypothetical protein
VMTRRQRWPRGHVVSVLCCGLEPAITQALIQTRASSLGELDAQMCSDNITQTWLCRILSKGHCTYLQQIPVHEMAGD